ncbi:hypothetical protein L596_009832 [Steinernema carpocapsae]|uniref:Uncharacterized protein n=1 Tax=Steinernema carpocapsae TaxID=34508 RepID=A0A4U5PGT7_STECR|nr:hypothetical protein L596_009832 [Steinernema carpocapsae]
MSVLNYAYRQTLNFVVLYVLPVTYLTGNQIFEIISDGSCPIFTLTHTAITPRLTTLTLYIYMLSPSPSAASLS